MDKVTVTSVIILAVIAVIEGVSLFCGSAGRKRKLTFAAVIPVFPEDDDLRERLEYLTRKLSGGACSAGSIIIVNYGAAIGQLEICELFCSENPNAFITDPAGLEKILSKTFAIERKT